VDLQGAPLVEIFRVAVEQIAPESVPALKQSSR
jgi:hypothetical protein